MHPMIEITEAQSYEFRYNKAGEEKTLHKQRALFHRGDGVVLPSDVMLNDASKPYPVGKFELSPESFSADRYGVACRPVPLVPAVAARKVAGV